jgi:methionyl-tRNA formyltransferase
VRVIFAGTPNTAADALRGLLAASYEIALVVTRPDAPTGRKQTLTESPVAVTARELGLEVVKADVITEDVHQKIINANADIGVVVAFGSFLSDDTLKLLPKGWINLHFSLLPKFRGAAPVQHAILNGECETGISVFQIDASMDGGDVYIQVPTTIEPAENYGRLLQRLTDLGISALIEVLPQIASGIAQKVAQVESEKSFAPKISREHARINWSSPASKIESLICAMNPEPMAWADLNGTSIRILSGLAMKTKNESQVEIGTVSVFENAVYVQCANGTRLSLLEVQPAGKKVMSAGDWMRGQLDPLGIKLG